MCHVVGVGVGASRWPFGPPSAALRATGLPLRARPTPPRDYGTERKVLLRKKVPLERPEGSIKIEMALSDGVVWLRRW